MERVKQYFIARNAAHLIERIRVFTESSATVELAAQCLQCEPAHIAKSLSYVQKRAMSKAEAKQHQKALLEQRKRCADSAEGAGSDGDATASGVGSPTSPIAPPTEVIIIVAAGDARVNPKKYKEKFTGQPRMVKREEVEELIGFPAGGVCPFGVNENVKVYLDVSLKRFARVYPAAGTSNTGIGLTVEELEEYASNVVEWVDLCEGWQDAVVTPTVEGEACAPESTVSRDDQKILDNEVAKQAETA